MTPTVTSDNPNLPRNRFAGKAAWLLLFLLAFLVWAPRLVRSFWIDEAGTYWMAHEGLRAAIEKTWHWPCQSILYSAIASFFCIGTGTVGELLLRIPTLAGIVAAAYFVHKLAEALIGRGAGFVAVALLLFHPTIIVIGAQARPYGLAVAAVAASLWTLYRWVASGARKYLIGYAAAAALIIYLHYFFALVLAAHAAYLLYALLARREPRRLIAAGGAFLAIGLLSTPLIPHLRLLMHDAPGLPVASVPAPAELAEALLPQFVAVAAFAFAALLRLLKPGHPNPPAQPPNWAMALPVATWFAGPVLLFSFCHVFSLGAFLPRYLVGYAPALALILAWAAYSVFPPPTVRVWVLLTVFSLAGPVSAIGWLRPGILELRPAIRIAQAESGVEAPPLIYQSGLVESNFQNWQAGNARSSYLYAPLVAYPVRNPIIPLPLKLTTEVKAQALTMIQPQLKSQHKLIAILLRAEAADWLIEVAREAGFDAKVQEPNLYRVVTLVRRR